MAIYDKYIGNPEREAREARFAQWRTQQGLGPEGRLVSDSVGFAVRDWVRSSVSVAKVLETAGLPDSIVSTPGADSDIVGLGPLASGERDYWWVTSKKDNSAAGFGVRVDAQDRARDYFTWNRFSYYRYN